MLARSQQPPTAFEHGVEHGFGPQQAAPEAVPQHEPEAFLAGEQQAAVAILIEREREERKLKRK